MGKKRENVPQAGGDLFGTSQHQMAFIHGVSINTYRMWISQKGCPGGERVYSVRDSISWRLKHEREQWSSAADIDDEIGGIGVSDSPALERCRERKAELLAMEVEQRRKNLVPWDQLVPLLGTLSRVIRERLETVQRNYGDGPRDIIEEALVEFDAMIERGINAGESD